jgi:hypothetical protein
MSLGEIDLSPYMKKAMIMTHPILWSSNGLSCIMLVSGFIKKDLQGLETKLMDCFVAIVVWNIEEGRFGQDPNTMRCTLDFDYNQLNV